MGSFRWLVDDLELKEVHLGRAFTWSSARDRPTLERINRFSSPPIGKICSLIVSCPTVHGIRPLPTPFVHGLLVWHQEIILIQIFLDKD